MHVLIAGLYAVTIWLSALAYVLIIGGPLLAFLVWSPFIISGAIVALLVLDLAVCGVGWTWRRWRPARVN